MSNETLDYWIQYYDDNELAEVFEAKVINSEDCGDYDDVDAISTKAWELFIEQPEYWVSEGLKHERKN